MPDASDPNSVRITLEALNIAQKEIASAQAGLDRLNASNARLTATTETQTVAAAQSAAAINTVGTSSQAAGTKIDFFSGGLGRSSAAMKLAHGSAQALNPIILTLGFTSYPKLTMAIFGATQALEAFHKAGVATALTLGKIAAVAVLVTEVVATAFTGVQALIASDQMEKINATLVELEKARFPGVVKAMEQMRDSGRLSADEFDRLMTIMGDGSNFEAMSEVRQRLLAIGDARQPIKATTDEIERLENLAGRSPSASGRIEALKGESKEIARQIGFLTSVVLANKNAAHSYEEKTKALEKNREIIKEIDALEVKQFKTSEEIAAAKIKLNNEVYGSVATTLGAAADAAKLFGRKGFVTWKAFAIGQAVINAALAISNELAQGDIYSKIFRVIAVGALAAVQIATIAAQQPSGFAQGGLIPGPPSIQDNRFASVATGEYIFDTRSVQAMGPEWFGSLHAAIRAGNLESLPELSGFSPQIVVSSAALGGLVGPTPSTAPLAQTIRAGFINTRQEMRNFMLQEGFGMFIDMANRRGNRLRG